MNCRWDSRKMLTSHEYSSSYHQEGMTDQSDGYKMMSTTSPPSNDMFGPPSTTSGPPESSSNGSTTNTALDSSPAPNFSGDDEFDNLGIHIPQSALGEDQGYNNYHQQQHPYHQQHMYHQQMHQQQWHQGYNMSNGYSQTYDQYGYGGYGNMYQQGANGSGHVGAMGQGGSVGMGGPSPVGSHNTPSPQAHSDDGFLSGEDHIRNNNILKRPSPGVSSGTGSSMHSTSQGLGGSGAATAAAGTAGASMVHGSNTGMSSMSHVHPHQTGPHVHHPQYHHHHHPGYGHHLHPHQIPQGIPIAKKPKVSKRKKKRDPNEPSKPVSAYALFFRDSQASIKIANPNAAFGDVSKIVASLWDALDPDSKAAYKKRTENAKKEYLKKLAAYRASLVSKGSDSGIGYGYYSYGEVLKNNGIHASSSNNFLGTSSASGSAGSSAGPAGSTGVPPSSNPSQHGYNSMSQPIPPRPPMQHGHHMHHGQGAYMMHGQQQVNVQKFSSNFKVGKKESIYKNCSSEEQHFLSFSYFNEVWIGIYSWVTNERKGEDLFFSFSLSCLFT